jgi:hypothetical protein
VAYVYRGDFLPFLNDILCQFYDGRSVSEIEQWCADNRGKFGVLRDYGLSVPVAAYPSQATIRYILRRYGLMPWPEKNAKPAAPRLPRCRVIDVGGGPRGVWIEHTPESNFREYSH